MVRLYWGIQFENSGAHDQTRGRIVRIAQVAPLWESVRHARYVAVNVRHREGKVEVVVVP